MKGGREAKLVDRPYVYGASQAIQRWATKLVTSVRTSDSRTELTLAIRSAEAHNHDLTHPWEVGVAEAMCAARWLGLRHDLQALHAA
jgi:hypothetical protein